MKDTRSKFIYLFSVFFLLAACSSDKDVTVAEEPVEEPVVIEETEEPEPELEAEPEFATAYPLSGMETDDEVDYRAFGVMIENSTSARPQTGLYQADVVYEVLSEGTITRFLAFFHSQRPDRIGPVRSARDYYIFLNNGYDAIYASAGGSPDAFALIESGHVDHISGLIYDGRFFSRSSDRKAPHNMYTTYEDLVEAANQIGYEVNRPAPGHLLFAKELEFAVGEEALNFEISYGSTSNNVQYKYDEELKTYRRSNGGVPIEDLETGDPVAPKNVFIVEAPHEVIDKQQRRDIDVEAGGRGYLIQEGLVQEVEWRNVDGMILPFKNEEQLPFLPGQTWINLIPSQNGGLDNYVQFFDGEDE